MPGYDGFVRVPVPDDAGVTTFGDQLMVTLRTPWLDHPAGALLAAPLEPFMRAKDDAARAPMLTVLFEPTDTCSLEARSATKNYLILSALDNVVTELRFWRYDAAAASGRCMDARAHVPRRGPRQPRGVGRRLADRRQDLVHELGIPAAHLARARRRGVARGA